jgi:hypothetical protein
MNRHIRQKSVERPGQTTKYKICFVRNVRHRRLMTRPGARADAKGDSVPRHGVFWVLRRETNLVESAGKRAARLETWGTRMRVAWGTAQCRAQLSKQGDVPTAVSGTQRHEPAYGTVVTICATRSQGTSLFRMIPTVHSGCLPK